jgi:hypothetical protein
VSLVYDGLLAALLHRTSIGRRHVVVAFTDGEDCGSVVRPDHLRSLGRRVEATLYWLPAGSARVALRLEPVNNGPFNYSAVSDFEGTESACDQSPVADPAVLREMVEATGGEVYTGRNNDNATRAIREVIENYRQTYVLRYTPTGVSRLGWHALAVYVSGRGYTVRARAGYLVEQTSKSTTRVVRRSGGPGGTAQTASRVTAGVESLEVAEIRGIDDVAAVGRRRQPMAVETLALRVLQLSR